MGRIVYLRYLVASAAALSLDFAMFKGGLAVGFSPVASSAVGYGAGVGAHWMFSSRAVFAGRLAESGASRLQQQALFAGSALVGLAATVAVVGAGTRLGADPHIAKLAAIALSFQLTYFLRSRVVFA